MWTLISASSLSVALIGRWEWESWLSLAGDCRGCGSASPLTVEKRGESGSDWQGIFQVQARFTSVPLSENSYCLFQTSSLWLPLPPAWGPPWKFSGCQSLPALQSTAKSSLAMGSALPGLGWSVKARWAPGHLSCILFKSLFFLTWKSQQ